MFTWLRRLLIGTPLPSSRAMHERLIKILALPVFASDAISSVAYATEEILLALIVAGPALVTAGNYSIYISIAIVALLAIVATSYRQTIFAYPSGGGSYIVAKDNLGVIPGLTAGASLMIDYVLTVAVSISSGVAAIVSIHPNLAPYTVDMAVGAVLVIMLANLRGLKESGTLFAIPAYAFIVSALVLIGMGVYHVVSGVGFTVPTPPPGSYRELPLHDFTGIAMVFLVLKAFSSGCSAMTGTEAISNGIPAFRPPESKNAATTLVWMALLLGTLFLGITFLAWKGHVIPMDQTFGGYKTVMAQIADTLFTGKWAWFVKFLQYATAAILVLAANTSFADFPRLGSIMARDRFLPRQLYNVGDRLVFSNGIVLLSLLAIGLIVTFNGIVNALIPLYAIGVFLSFTLSQAGMVKHTLRLKERGWQISALISGVGACVTAVVCLIQASTKFLDGEPKVIDLPYTDFSLHIRTGAWIVLVLIPALAFLFYKINQHYVTLGNQLRLTPNDKFERLTNTVLVLTPSLHRGVLPALEYAKTLSSDVRAIHVDTDPLDAKLLEERWDEWGGGLPLVILESPYRSITGPLLKYLEEVKREKPNSIVTVVLPEFVPAKMWHKVLHNQSGLLLKFILMFRKDIVTANVRFYVDK